jgi:hypothetical protein
VSTLDSVVLAVHGEKRSGKGKTNVKDMVQKGEQNDEANDKVLLPCG